MAGKNTAFHRDRVEKNNEKKNIMIRCEQIVNKERFLPGFFFWGAGGGGGKKKKKKKKK
jgi:hypothetical protein